MQSRIQEWRNSLALRIPKSFAREIGLERDVPVSMSLEDGRLVAVPVGEPTITLERLLEQVTEENVHHEVETSTGIR